MKNKGLIPLTFGLCLVTIFLAWYSVKQNSSDIVFAQNPYPIGCYNVYSTQATCISCQSDGIVNQAQSFSGTGNQTIDTRDTVCNTTDYTEFCSYINNQVAVSNPFCATPTPTPTPVPGTCNQPPPCATGFVVGSNGLCTRSNQFQNRCLPPSGYDANTCTCPDGTSTSPIIIDVDSSDFSLTDVANGVDFDILAVGFPQHLSWTASGSTNAFLVLDRDGNGTIDNGEELFGNLTPQPPSTEANGFLALAEYDKTANGGNGDGRINNQDAIFNQLRLWQDTNHNGISEQGELHMLSSLNIAAIDLKYKESKRTDQYGNRFRYRAKVFDSQGTQIGRWAWDVFLITQ
jgi:hypothetical protein